MNKFEITKNILHLNKEDFKYGVAEVSVGLLTAVYLMDELEIQTGEDMPSANQFISFMTLGRQNYKKNDITLSLKVIDPERDDFRVEIIGIAINSEYAKLNTKEDMDFWAAFMNLGYTGDAYMQETEDEVSWEW